MSEIRRTACNRDCPDACSLLVTVDDDGRAVGLRGDPDDPITQGFLCERTSRFLERHHHPSRLTRPLLRVDGRLTPVSWEQALDAAAQRLLAIRDESGPAAILHYLSGGSLGILKALPALLFERFGPVTIKRGDICSGAAEAAQQADFGVSESHGLDDLANSASILLWGKNPHTSSVHLLPVLRACRAAGARIVGVDPVRTRAAELCDAFLQPRPGADFDLAMAVARRLFDRGDVDEAWAARCDGLEGFRAMVHARSAEQWAARADVTPDEVELLVGPLADDAACNIQLGWGLGRRRNGWATTRAIDALGALSGNLGRPGGGVSYYFGRRTAFDLDFVRGLDAAPRSLSEARLGRELLEARDPPIRAAWITAGNPVAMLPDSATVRRALEATEFVVVVDTHPTDTTDVADLVLPTLTLLEDDDVLGAYGNHMLRESRPAVEPPGGGDGPRHELHILQGLAERLGLGAALAGDVEHWKRRVTRRLEAAGAGLDAMRVGPLQNPFAEPVLFADGRVRTPSGRVQLLEVPAAEAPSVDGRWPLTLLAVSTPKAQSSQWSVDLGDARAEVRVHPDAAAGLADGAPARLVSALGELAVIVRHDDGVRRDVALMAKGGMLRDGRCANLLVAAHETDAGGGASYYDERVRLEPA